MNAQASQKSVTSPIQVIGTLRGRPEEIKARFAKQSGNRLVRVRTGVADFSAVSPLVPQKRWSRPISPLGGQEYPIAYLLNEELNADGTIRSIRIGYCQGFARGREGFEIASRQVWEVAVIRGYALVSVEELN